MNYHYLANGPRLVEQAALGDEIMVHGVRYRRARSFKWAGGRTVHLYDRAC